MSLTWSDEFLEPDLPLGLPCVDGLLVEAEGDAPWRWGEARAGDRDPELPLASPGSLLRGILLGSR